MPVVPAVDEDDVGDESLAAGLPLKRFDDPQLAELVVEMKGLRESRSQTTGKGEGSTATWAAVAVIATLPDARHDTPSIVLHRRLGFEVVGRMPGVGYKQGQWVDTVLMQKDVQQR